MTPRRTVEDWRRAVYRSRNITDAVRVMLLYLADRMGADRKVSVPRAHIAAALGVSERLVTERVAAAHRAEFLATVSKGRKYSTAVYQGLFPSPAQATENPYPDDSLSGKPTSPLRRTEIPYPESRLSGNPGVPAISTADPSAVVDDGDVSNDERPESTEPDSWLTPGGWSA